jgi:hypothetical protein
MATQGSSDPLELMTAAQGKIIAGFEDLVKARLDDTQEATRP